MGILAGSSISMRGPSEDVMPCRNKFQKNLESNSEDIYGRVVRTIGPLNCTSIDKSDISTVDTRSARRAVKQRSKLRQSACLKSVTLIITSFIEASMYSHRHLAASYAMQLRRTSLAGHDHTVINGNKIATQLFWPVQIRGCSRQSTDIPHL